MRMSLFITWTILSSGGDIGAPEAPAGSAAKKDIATKLLRNPCICAPPQHTVHGWRRSRLRGRGQYARKEQPHVPQACVLAVIAGYGDTIGFLRFDAFAG